MKKYYQNKYMANIDINHYGLKKDLGIAIFFFVLAFSLRVVYWELSGHYLERDAITYISNADALIQGGRTALSAYNQQNPRIIFYCWLISKIDVIIGNVELSAVLLSMLSGSFLVVAGLLLTIHMGVAMKQAGILALFLTIHPILIDFSVQPLREMPFFFCLFCCVLLFYISINRMWRSAFFSSFCSGLFFTLAIMLRIEALELFLLLPLAIAYCAEKEIALIKLFTLLGIFFCSALTFLLCYSFMVWGTALHQLIAMKLWMDSI